MASKDIKKIEMVLKEVEKRRELIKIMKRSIESQKNSIEKLQREVIRIMMYESLSYYRICKDIDQDLKYKFVSVYRKKKKLWK
jgi:hypothetical protein